MGAILPDRKIDSPLLTDPPEPAAPEGFLLPAARPHRTSRQWPERGTRISGLALERRVPKCAGPAGGNEAMSRTPMAERTQWVRNVRRVDSAAIEFF
ncbi:hypothetical protein XF30_22960 [Bradyrhizobium sp. SUTN9-2]|nr:hypothetical protein XF30_22960 [Bradyrhizobium sp. SUTN9-2]